MTISKRRILTLFIQCLTITALSQESGARDSSLIQGVLTGKFIIIHSKEKIDQKFLAFLRKNRGINLRLVNPGQPFNDTDLIMNDLPKHELVFATKNPEGINFIVYGNGNGAAQNICLIYSKIGRSKFITSTIRVDDSVNSLERLKAAIDNDSYDVLH